MFYSNNPIHSINIFLAVVFVPLLVALVLKILSVTKYSNSTVIEKAWKYALVSYTFYGILFLAYG